MKVGRLSEYRRANRELSKSALPASPVLSTAHGAKEMKMTSVLEIRDHGAKLTLDQLAEALYEGTPHLQNLAEKLARQHGKAGALSFYGLMGDDVQNFWRGIAKQIIDHAAEWQENKGSSCSLSKRERDRLRALPRVDASQFPGQGE